MTGQDVVPFAAGKLRQEVLLALLGKQGAESPRASRLAQVLHLQTHPPHFQRGFTIPRMSFFAVLVPYAHG